MRKLLLIGVGPTVALVMILSAAPASAVNEYVGSTYEKASSQISAGGRTPVIRTKQGSYLPTDQCIVTGSRAVKGGKTFLDLNCNGGTAAGGHPGNSLASPAGQKALLAMDRAVRMSKNYEQSLAQGKTPSCFMDAGSTQWCAELCTSSRACSAQLSKALGL